MSPGPTRRVLVFALIAAACGVATFVFVLASPAHRIPVGPDWRVLALQGSNAVLVFGMPALAAVLALPLLWTRSAGFLYLLFGGVLLAFTVVNFGVVGPVYIPAAITMLFVGALVGTPGSA